MTEDFVTQAVERLHNDTVTVPPDSPRSVVSDIEIEVKELDKMPVTKKVKLKSDLINDCIELKTNKSKRALGRLKKADLELHLSELFENKCQEAVQLDAGINLEDAEEPKQNTSNIPGMDDEFVTELLFRMTLSCCNLVEYGSKTYSKYIGNMCLHNWSANLERNQHLSAMMKQSLFEIYSRNIETLSVLMTCEGRLGAALLLSGISSIRRNAPHLSEQHGHNWGERTREDYSRVRHVPPRESGFNRPMRRRGGNEQRNRNGPVGLDPIKEQPRVPVLAPGRNRNDVQSQRAFEEDEKTPPTLAPDPR